MKIIFFSDIHGNLLAMESFCEAIKHVSYDRIIFCGDVMGYGYYADQVCNMMQELGTWNVMGNHDQMYIDAFEDKIPEIQLVNKYGASYKDIETILSDDNRLYIGKAKQELDIEDSGLRIKVIHGSLDNPLNGRIYPDTDISNTQLYRKYDFIFEGHTHYRMIRRVGKTLVVNPGSIGLPRDGGKPSFLVFDTESRELSFEECLYDYKSIKLDILQHENENTARRMIEVWNRIEGTRDEN